MFDLSKSPSARTVLAALGPYPDGTTADQLVTDTGLTRKNVTARLSNLKTAGLACPIGNRRTGKTWRLTAHGSDTLATQAVKTSGTTLNPTE